MGTGIKLEAGKLYMTRSGLKVRVLATDLSSTTHTVAATVTDKGEEHLTRFTKDGCFGGLDDYSNWDIVGPWVEPKKTKIVYEWRTKNKGQPNWTLSAEMCTEEEAPKVFEWYDLYVKTGRQFEVEVEE